MQVSMNTLSHSFYQRANRHVEASQKYNKATLALTTLGMGVAITTIALTAGTAAPLALTVAKGTKLAASWANLALKIRNGMRHQAFMDSADDALADFRAGSKMSEEQLDVIYQLLSDEAAYLQQRGVSHTHIAHLQETLQQVENELVKSKFSYSSLEKVRKAYHELSTSSPKKLISPEKMQQPV